MDFSAKLDDLQQRAADAKAAAQAAVSESREQLRQRIDQARVDVDLAAKDARQDAGAERGDGVIKHGALRTTPLQAPRPADRIATRHRASILDRTRARV
jgi:hypothetical protein